MQITSVIFFTLLGTAVGSFLNVCVDRLPAGKSLVRPPSHCDSCQHPLSPAELIPVLSYLWLRGRCRHCKALISLRPMWVELGMGFLFAFLYWYYGLSVELAAAAFYCSLFVIILFIDLEHKLILNKVVYPAAAAALIISFFLPQPGFLSEPLSEPLRGAINAIIGGAIGFLFLLIPALINPKGMGWGDVKMAGLIGLVTGSSLVLVAMVIGVVLGGVVAMILLLFKIKKRKEVIPFGPFLSLATIVTLLWGTDILNWYLGLF